MPDQILIDKAVALLSGKFNNRSDLEAILDFLVERAPFDDLEPDELEEIGRAACARLSPTPQRGANQRAQGRGAPAAGGATRAREWGNAPKPSAPFRFVDLADQVTDGENQPYNTPRPDGLSACIDVTWVAETPLLIGEENEKTKMVEPLRLGPNGPFVIPGASLRGMIRAATEIIALGRLGFANLHHRYGLRDFDHRYYAAASVSRVDKVKAGWLCQKGKGKNAEWELTPLGDNWAHVEIDRIPFAGSDWKGRDLPAKYGAASMVKGQLFEFGKIHMFSEITLNNNGRRSVSPEKSGQSGVYVFSGKVPGKDSNKRFEYVFFDKPIGSPVEITAAKRTLFERLYSKPSKNRLEADGNWKIIKKTLEAGDRIPVFYVGDPAHQGDDFFFGLTRLFKIPHKYSVGDVVRRSHERHLPLTDAGAFKADFVQNLFGYVVERDEAGLAAGERLKTALAARKGRIAFSFARLAAGEPQPRLSEPIETIMMAPRASYAPFYLRGAEDKDYSADRPPRLAGRKRYLPRGRKIDFAEALAQIRAMGEGQIAAVRASSRSGQVSDDVKTKLRFLMPATGRQDISFTSQVRLHNVSKEELGAVLFALTHGGDPQKICRHMLGRAKSFGAGQIRVAEAKLTVTANSDGESKKDVEHKPYLDAFVAHMKKGATKYPDIPSIREFLGASIPAEVEKQHDTLAYMPLADFNAIRKKVKPLKPRETSGGIVPGERAARGPDEKKGDGRLLPVPERQFWP